MSAKLLVVDDDSAVLRLLELELSPLYTVVTAMSGPEGWALLEKGKPDLLVLDLILPGFDGLEFCERLRSHPDLSGLPVIIVTGATKDEELPGGFWKMGTGADVFLEKPVSGATLRSEVDRLLKEKAGWKELPPGKGYYD